MYTAFFTLLLTVSPPQAPPSYAREVLPILQQKCLACHSGAAKMGGLVMESYESLMKGGAHGPVIVPGKGSESRIIFMLEGKVLAPMPFNRVLLCARDIE